MLRTPGSRRGRTIGSWSASARRPTRGSLIRAGSALARAEGGDLLVLKVISLLEQLPRTEVERTAELEWGVVDRLLSEHGDEAVTASAMVRIAPTTEAGILSTATRHRVDLLLLDWPQDRMASDEQEAMVQRVLIRASQTVAVLRGQLPEGPLKVAAAVSGAASSAPVLQLAEAVARDSKGECSAIHVHGRRQSAEQAQAIIEGVVESAEASAPVRLVESENAVEGVVQAAKDSDLVVVGSTHTGSEGRFGTGGLWLDLIEVHRGPALLVRRPEPRRARWLKELWDLAYLGMPTLSAGEKAEVYADMRHQAKATQDFYVLIVIASGIASFGLAQNSAAVIIGAMLVAPLMSPIIAIAHGIVQGNMTMVRRSVTSTGKGTLVSIAVATVFVMAFPDFPPTDQILARTEPTMLDLLVGLAAGAAAAYGVSRKSVAAALPGVAISVALVPPLCVVGYGLAADRLDISIGSMVLFLTNLTAIILVSVLVFLLLGFTPRDRERRGQLRDAMGLNLVFLTFLSIPLGLTTLQTTKVNRLEAAVERVFRNRALERDFDLRNVLVERVSGTFLIKAEIWSTTGLEGAQEVLQTIEHEVEDETSAEVDLQLWVVQANKWPPKPLTVNPHEEQGDESEDGEDEAGEDEAGEDGSPPKGHSDPEEGSSGGRRARRRRVEPIGDGAVARVSGRSSAPPGSRRCVPAGCAAVRRWSAGATGTSGPTAARTPTRRSPGARSCTRPRRRRVPRARRAPGPR